MRSARVQRDGYTSVLGAVEDIAHEKTIPVSQHRRPRVLGKFEVERKVRAATRRHNRIGGFGSGRIRARLEFPAGTVLDINDVVGPMVVDAERLVVYSNSDGVHNGRGRSFCDFVSDGIKEVILSYWLTNRNDIRSAGV